MGGIRVVMRDDKREARERDGEEQSQSLTFLHNNSHNNTHMQQQYYSCLFPPSIEVDLPPYRLPLFGQFLRIVRIFDMEIPL